MEFTDKYDLDMKPNTETYFLVKQSWGIDLGTYNEHTLTLKEHSEHEKAVQGNAFLRHGFADAIRNLDENVLTPMYVDMQGKPVENVSKEKALDEIFQGRLSLKGFEYNPQASQEQIDKAFGSLITDFVCTTQKPDYTNPARKNVFCFVRDNNNEVKYINQNENRRITSRDVKLKLGLLQPQLQMNNLKNTGR